MFQKLALSVTHLRAILKAFRHLRFPEIGLGADACLVDFMSKPCTLIFVWKTC